MSDICCTECGYVGQAWVNGYQHLTAVEKAGGFRYTHVLQSRPDASFMGALELLAAFPTDTIAVPPFYDCAGDMPATWEASKVATNFSTYAFCETPVIKNLYGLSITAALMPRRAAEAYFTSQRLRVPLDVLEDACGSSDEEARSCGCKVKIALRQSRLRYAPWPVMVKIRRPYGLCLNPDGVYPGERPRYERMIFDDYC